MDDFDEREYRKNKATERLIYVLMAAPIIVVGVEMLFPGKFSTWLILSLIVIAAVYCISLYKLREVALLFAAIPAFICLISGFDIFYDYLNYGVGTVGTISNAFCYFITGVFFLYSLVSHLSSKEKKPAGSFHLPDGQHTPNIDQEVCVLTKSPTI